MTSVIVRTMDDGHHHQHEKKNVDATTRMDQLQTPSKAADGRFSRKFTHLLSIRTGAIGSGRFSRRCQQIAVARALIRRTVIIFLVTLLPPYTYH